MGSAPETQCIAAVLGAVAVRGLVPGAAGTDLGMTATQLSWPMALGIEVVLTFFLMFVITAVATDGRAQGGQAGIAIGGAVAMGALMGGPLTGASMNPARSLGPALVAGDVSGLWLYAVAPVAGAVLGAVVYQWIQHCQNGPAESAGGCC
jgi:aquaporin NIP